MDIIPSDLATYGNEAKTLLEDLQSRNERMFLVTILVMNLADKRQKLENNVFQTAGIAQKYNCALRRLAYQQEQGFVSSLPLGVNQVEIQRGLTTSSTAIFVPLRLQASASSRMFSSLPGRTTAEFALISTTLRQRAKAFVTAS